MGTTFQAVVSIMRTVIVTVFFVMVTGCATSNLKKPCKLASLDDAIPCEFERF